MLPEDIGIPLLSLPVREFCVLCYCLLAYLRALQAIFPSLCREVDNVTYIGLIVPLVLCFFCFVLFFC